MIFYLGDKINTVPDNIRNSRNKAKLWKYGYCKEFDTVIISKDGTLGEVYRVSGINIGLPEVPKSKKEIINGEIATSIQYWVRKNLPEGLNKTTVNNPKYRDYIDQEYERRDKGVWIMLNGKPVYLTGTYYFFIQWIREDDDYPRLRVIQNELMIFWEACKADNRCYGMQYVKNRRFGASALGFTELLDSGTINENKVLGMISKKGDDAKKIFGRMIRSFKRLPAFFQPIWDGTNTPKVELVLSAPTKRTKAGEKENHDGLDTTISWHNTGLNAMDGEAIFRSVLDESGKFPKDVPFDKYWEIVKTSHRKGKNIIGKSFVCSTVNAKKMGGAEFEKIWKRSDATERNQNVETKSGLYRLFIAAKYCMEGFFDRYGFSIVEDPKEPTKNDLGEYVKIGAKTYLKNEYDGLDPENQHEHKRQFPDSPRDAFLDEASDCAFSIKQIDEQLEHNEYALNQKEDETNDEVERGNFYWKNGIQDTEVIWKPETNGRFWIAKNCHPAPELRNRKTKKMINGVLAFAPENEHIGSFGVDPYNRSKTVDGKGSKGAIHLQTKFNTESFPNNAFILEYIDRPRTVELFFEDVIMAMHYYSMPMLAELSNEKFLTTVIDRGYRHFSLNNPFKNFEDLSDTEKKYGGVPPQDTKIGDQQFYTIESYIINYVGVARDNSERPIGDMGHMPFTRTLIQWKETDPEHRTKYDAYISSSLAALANQRRTKKKDIEKKPIKIPFTRYDNSGAVSIIMN